jgi:catechol 2,3-dioxygenase-like lactoylglutathione lyase family enzyme
LQPVFESITHIGIVVKDIKETVKNYSLKYGIGPWSIYDCDSSNVEAMNVDGKKEDYTFRSARCLLGETGLELIQPLDSKSIYADFLKDKGQYLHHLGYGVSDFNDAIRLFKQKGFSDFQGGNFYSKDEFIYFDTRKELKHIINFSNPGRDFFKFKTGSGNISYPVIPAPQNFFPPPEKQNKMPAPVFNRIGQVAFIVKSVDEMVKRYNDEYGIGPWRIWEFGPDTVNDMTIHGKREDYRMRLALARVGDIDFELIQPRDEKSIYADFLKSSGEGFHHLAYEVDDFFKLMEYGDQIGLKVSMSGVWCGKHTWVYMTTGDDLKHIVELNYTEPGFVYPDPSDYYPAR